MDKIVKQQILQEINELEVNDLLEMIEANEIRLEEMVDAGLERAKLNSIQEILNQVRAVEKETISPDAALQEIKEICSSIENGEYGVLEIRNFLLNGVVTSYQLKEYTSMTDEIIERINYYQKQDTPFMDWENLPPLQLNRTDIYFLGQPGSGKSCVLGSLFHYFDKMGLLAENMQNQIGTLYRNQLKDEFGYGILPDSTAVDGVNYMPIELRNLRDTKLKHPLNFVEMSGEIFDTAYEKGIQSIHPKVKEYLSNRNRKILFFIIDYDLHKRAEKMSFGAGQASKLTAVLEILDNYGTLSKVDSIYVLVTKGDLFPADRDKVEYANEFINNYYLNFVNNLKDKKDKYSNKNSFKITIYPFSIGEVKFRDMLVKIDPSGAEYATKAIQRHAFVGQEPSFFNKIFGN
jgi:GTPase SAR1 family protein